MSSYDSAPFLDCDGCAGTAGRMGCPTHGEGTIHYPGVAEVAYVLHQHRWIYDGILRNGSAIFHCDDHDPPIVRQVWPTVTP